MKMEEFYRQALEDLEQSNLMPPLVAAAAALVPNVPEWDIDMPHCLACEKVLCGACGRCHGFGSGVVQADCFLAQEMNWACAIWFQAYRAVRDVQRRGEQWSECP